MVVVMFTIPGVLAVVGLVLGLLQLHDSLKEESHVCGVIMTQVVMVKMMVEGITKVVGLCGFITLVTGVMVVLQVILAVLLTGRPIELQVLVVVNGQGRCASV